MNKNIKPLPEYDDKTIYPHFKVLSSSQFLAYEKDPRQFFNDYELGAKSEGTLKMSQGRVFSALYADRTLPFREYLKQMGAKPRVADRFEYAIKLMPVLKGGHPEYPLIANYGGWGFRATLDDFVEEIHVIVENKTGEKVWTQERADTDDQINFQAWSHLVKYTTVPKKIIVNWVDLRAGSNQILNSFITKRSLTQLKEFQKRVDVVIANLEAGNFSTHLYG